MKIQFDQLASHLQHNQLLPIYFISGDEMLLVEEARDLIRQTAKQVGFVERNSYEVTKDFDWHIFLTNSFANSLFTDKSLIELRMPSKLNNKCTQALVTYMENLPSGKILVLISEKCDQHTQKATWYQMLCKQGAHIPIWMLTQQQLLPWIKKKLQSVGLTTDSQGLHYLAEFTENNLFATTQEIQKLALLYGQGFIAAEQITTAISDHAHFDVFALSDSLLVGNNKRIIRVLQGLKQEDIETTLILWAITREIRTLINLKYLIALGQDLAILFKQYKIWPKRQPLFKHALTKHTLKKLYLMLLHAQEIDCMIKGICSQNVWEEILRLSLTFVDDN